MDIVEQQKYIQLGKLHNEIKFAVNNFIQIGTKIINIRHFIESEIRKRNVNSAFPVGININNMVAHFSPFVDDTQIINNGDLVTIDFGVELDGCIIDSAFTKEIETFNHTNLIESSRLAVLEGIRNMKPHKKFEDVGEQIYNLVRSREHYVVKELSGHLIGKYKVHAGKSVPCYKKHNYQNDIDKYTHDINVGEVYAIEVFTTYNPQRLKSDIKTENISHFSVNTDMRFSDLPNKDLQMKFLKLIQQFKTIPFHKEELNKIVGHEDIVYLVNHRFLIAYPPLYIENDVSSQWEYTIIITDKDTENIIL